MPPVSKHVRHTGKTSYTYLADVVDRTRSPSEGIHGILQKRINSLKIVQHRVPQGQRECVGKTLQLVLDARLERKQTDGDAVNLSP